MTMKIATSRQCSARSHACQAASASSSAGTTVMIPVTIRSASPSGGPASSSGAGGPCGTPPSSASGARVRAGLYGMLWGGAVRMFALHHVTYSINSLCHFFGRRRFATDDHSRNLAWLAPLSFGEAWHNNHHAFPTSAMHGMGRSEFDVSGIVISAMERAGLVWDVTRIGADRQAAKAITG